MRTRQRHIISPGTAQRLAERKIGSWATLAETLGFSRREAPTLSAVARGVPGAVTLEGENILRHALGLAELKRVPVPPCPDCGLAHTGRCNGRPVAAVVCLAPGERVAGSPPTKKRRARSSIVVDCASVRPHAKRREAMGLSWREYMDWLDGVADMYGESVD